MRTDDPFGTKTKWDSQFPYPGGFLSIEGRALYIGPNVLRMADLNFDKRNKGGSFPKQKSPQAVWEGLTFIQAVVEITYKVAVTKSALGVKLPMTIKGRYEFQVRWKVLYTPHGAQIALIGKQPFEIVKEHDSPSYSVDVHVDLYQTLPHNYPPYTQMVVQATGTEEGSGGLSVAASISGRALGFSIGTQIGQSRPSIGTNIAGTEIELDIVPRPSPPFLIPAKLALAFPVWFDLGEKSLSSYQLGRLDTWARSVLAEEGVVKAIRNNEIDLMMIGHASKSASAGFNKILSGDRIKTIVRHVRTRNLLGGKIGITEIPMGKEEASTEEDLAHDMRVDILLHWKSSRYSSIAR